MNLVRGEFGETHGLGFGRDLESCILPNPFEK